MTADERRRLYDEVWAEPMVVVAKRYGLSDVGMAKLCRRAQIPVPPRGHWAQLRAGKHTSKRALPGVDDKDVARVGLPRVRPMIEQQPAESDAEIQAAFRRESSASFRIDPEAKFRPHRVVARLEALYRSGFVDEYGMLVLRQGSRRVIRSSRECLPRALRILNLFCHACAARGWSLRMEGDADYEKSYDPTWPLKVDAFGQVIEVTVEESSARRIASPPISSATDRSRKAPLEAMPSWRLGPRYEYDPTGLLTATAEWRGHKWRLSERRNGPRIDDRLNEFCTKVIHCAAIARRAKAKEEEEARRLDEAWREHEDREHLRQFQAQLVGDLESQAASWARYQQFAAYIAAVHEAYAAEPHLMESDQPLGRWLAWADAHVAQLDPRRRHKLDPENPPPVLRQPRPYRW